MGHDPKLRLRPDPQVIQPLRTVVWDDTLDRRPTEQDDDLRGHYLNLLPQEFRAALYLALVWIPVGRRAA
jgi:hypothetical protein